LEKLACEKVTTRSSAINAGLKTKRKRRTIKTMKKNLLAIGAVALAILATQQAAQATLVTSGTAQFTSTSSGTLSVNFDVTYSGDIYTYLYSFTPFSTGPITLFTINTSDVIGALTAGTSEGPYGTVTATGGTTTSQVYWYAPPSAAGTGPQLVGFTSYDGPGVGSGSMNDGNSGPWGDISAGTPIPVPVPVPEASTVLAGALMLLPFGIGAVRSLRKERVG
jgi:hypothetical protein